VINFDLTAEEQKNVRAALAFLRHRVGGWKSLARILHFTEKSLNHVGTGRKATPLMAFKISRLAGVSMDDVLTGKFPAPGTCPHCGRGPEGEIVYKLAGEDEGNVRRP
jgi:hypothetical protein